MNVSKRCRGVLATACCIALTMTASGGVAAKDNTAEIKAKLSAQFSQSRPGTQLGEITAAEIDGFYQIQVIGGPLLTVSADGRYFFTGDLYEVSDRGFVNIAEKQREGSRLALMKDLDVKDQIVFTPKQGARAAITVFTDVDCYYCQKLHQEVPDLNRLGIEVRYMAFPRAGIGSESYKKIASAWCADDQLTAMTKLKQREPIPSNVCADNPVADQYQLGKQIGVTGTPAIVTSSGRLMPGYMPAIQLARSLGLSVDPKLDEELTAKAMASMKQR